MNNYSPISETTQRVVLTRTLAAGELREVSPASELASTTPSYRRSIMSDAEVPAKPKRRQFTAAYKLSIVQEANRSTEFGQVAALLRREGLYESQLWSWRQQVAHGELAALKLPRRGRKPQPKSATELENERLQRENRQLQKRLQQAELIIDVQKKISQILGISQPELPLDGES